jgi:hypothetical protein
MCRYRERRDFKYRHNLLSRNNARAPVFRGHTATCQGQHCDFGEIHIRHRLSEDMVSVDNISKARKLFQWVFDRKEVKSIQNIEQPRLYWFSQLISKTEVQFWEV